ncbi:hypothetical protein TNCV_1965521 [Trichonephila clavipes]|nr:hypothetical protein TNCV_1965521 [Trichonephila clavipes]
MSSAELFDMTIDGKTTYLHLHNFVMRQGGGVKYSAVPCTRDSAHKTFKLTDLTNTYSVCTRRVFSGIGHRTQALRSEVRSVPTRLPTTLKNSSPRRGIEPRSPADRQGY